MRNPSFVVDLRISSVPDRNASGYFCTILPENSFEGIFTDL